MFTDDPSPESAFALIDRHRVTVTGLVNALAKLWTQACEWEPVLPRSLRLVQVGGSRISPEEARYIYDGLTTGLQQIFGMAEGMLQFTRPGDPRGGGEHPGAADVPHDELRVVDEQGRRGTRRGGRTAGPRALTPSTGTTVPTRRTPRSFSPDGFYRSGDRVRIFADGPGWPATSRSSAGSRTSSTAAVRRCRRPTSRTICSPTPRSTRLPQSHCPTTTSARRSAPQSSSGDLRYRLRRTQSPSSTSAAPRRTHGPTSWYRCRRCR